jgi:PAS domain S-box-containing protein
MMFGWSEQEVLGKPAREFGLIHEGDLELAATARRNLAEDRCSNTLSLRCHTKAGEIRHCRWYNSVVTPKDGSHLTILSLIEDATETVTAMKQIYRLAHQDTLTGLPNRTMLQDRLQRALASARRRRERVAVMMMDLDRFKNVNDTLGHGVGDELLKEVAARLASRLRVSDTLAVSAAMNSS